jgi:hypothetical protein
MNPSSFKFIIFILYYIYIFKTYHSKISLSSLSKKIFKHLRVSRSIKYDLLQILVTNYFGLPATLARENESNY